MKIFEEVKDGPKDADKDLLFGWIQQEHCKSDLILKEAVNPSHVQTVMVTGYAPDLKDDELDQMGRDPFLVAYALAEPAKRCVVTVEVSKSSRKRANRHLPDVCAAVGVNCCDPFTFLRQLGFRTDWKKRL